MRIVVETKPINQMRYHTQGDYRYLDDGTLLVEVAETGNKIFDELVGIHEIVEELLTRANGISEPEIMAFDVAHPLVENPGLELDAPYRDEHLMAEGIERILCGYLGIPWKSYDLAVDKAWDSWSGVGY